MNIKNLSFEKFISLLRKKTVIFAGIVLLLLSSLITITQGGNILINFLNESVRHKQVLYDALGHLSTETNISYFESLLGKPIFVNSYKKVNEYIFINDLFYVQGVTDKNDQILAYSVITTSENFNPKVPFFDSITLGKSKFIDLKNEDLKYNNPDWIISWLGAHDLFYTEGYYMANPGGYQSIFFSMTESGYMDYRKYKQIPDYYESPTINLSFKKYLDYSVKLFMDNNSIILPKEVSDFRSTDDNVINTYSVLGPFITLDDFSEIRGGDSFMYLLGPDYNQVRLLNN